MLLFFGRDEIFIEKKDSNKTMICEYFLESDLHIATERE
jgi:hypothetical protein